MASDDGNNTITVTTSNSNYSSTTTTSEAPVITNEPAMEYPSSESSSSVIPTTVANSEDLSSNIHNINNNTNNQVHRDESGQQEVDDEEIEFSERNEDDDDITVVSPLDDRRSSLHRSLHGTSRLLFGPTNTTPTNASSHRWVMSSPPLDEANEISNRQNELLRDLEQLQSYNCCHFATWCLIPTILMIFVLICVFHGPNNMYCLENPAPGVTCIQQGRLFSQAFIARCTCSSIDI